MSRVTLIGMLALFVVAAAASTACHGRLEPDPAPLAPADLRPPAEPTPPRAAPAVPAAVTAQIQRGGPLYANTCARCHGANGEGSGAAPAVIGPRALPASPPPGARTRRTSFRSAKDVGMFIMTTMPPDAQKLPPPDVAAVLAYLLDANGATPPQPVSPATAESMPIHRSTGRTSPPPL